MQPLDTNKRAGANAIFEEKSVKEEECWYGIEQEYTLFDKNNVSPIGWPSNGFPAPQVYTCTFSYPRTFE